MSVDKVDLVNPRHRCRDLKAMFNTFADLILANSDPVAPEAHDFARIRRRENCQAHGRGYWTVPGTLANDMARLQKVLNSMSEE
jgi:hypothetical protein